MTAPKRALGVVIPKEQSERARRNLEAAKATQVEVARTPTVPPDQEPDHPAPRQGLNNMKGVTNDGGPTWEAMEDRRRESGRAARQKKSELKPEAPHRTSWTAQDLLATTFPEPRWAVPGVIPEGLNLLAGPPKLGKSWLMLNVAIAAAAGGRALGKVPVDAGEVLYLALEDPPRRLKDRLLVALEGDPAPAGFHIETTWPLMHDGGAEQLETWLATHPAARLVVIDVFAKVRGVTSDREDRYAADYRALSRLKDVADAHRVALVAVHHTRKQQSEDYLDLVSGTHGLAGAADTILVLGRSRGSADATLNITGRDVEERKLALSLKAGRWTLLEGNAEDYEMGDTRRRVLSLIRSSGPKTPKQLATMLNADPALLRQTCRRMADAEQLDNDSGTYSLPVTPVTQSLEGDAVTGVTPIHDLFDDDDRWADELEGA